MSTPVPVRDDMAAGSNDIPKFLASFVESFPDISAAKEALLNCPWLKHECANNGSTFKDNERSFNDVLNYWKEIVTTCLKAKSSPKTCATDLMVELAKYDDIKFVQLEVIDNLLLSLQNEYCKSTIENICFLLVQMPTALRSKISDFTTFYSLSEPNGLKKKLSPKKLKRVYSDVWLKISKLKLPNSIRATLLLHIPDKVMPHMNNPILLTDFFFKSYDLKEPFNVIALNGLFVLIVKYNLDYPEFYKQVYGLLTPKIYNLENRQQFFQLLDLFLSSLHIPAYLVAAFVKRLSRLALTAPPDVILVILTLVKNWLIRHKGLDVLINRTNAGTVSDDPYDIGEEDPALSKASDSSLWEIKTLQSHYLHEIARKAHFIDRKPEAMEDLLNQKTMDQLMRQSMKRNFTDVKFVFKPPFSFFADDSLFNSCFCE